MTLAGLEVSPRGLHPSLKVAPEPTHSCGFQPRSYGVYTAVCETCFWMSADYTEIEDAERDARMHERGERHAWEVGPGGVQEWSPERRPFLGT